MVVVRHDLDSAPESDEPFKTDVPIIEGRRPLLLFYSGILCRLCIYIYKYIGVLTWIRLLRVNSRDKFIFVVFLSIFIHLLNPPSLLFTDDEIVGTFSLFICTLFCIQFPEMSTNSHNIIYYLYVYNNSMYYY